MIIRDFRHLLPDGPGTGSGTGSGDGAASSGAGSSGAGQGGSEGGGSGSGSSGDGSGASSGSGSGPGEPQDVASLPQWAQDLIGRTRTEAASHRTERNDARQRLEGLSEAVKRELGLSEAPTADQLADSLRTSQAETRQARIETAIARGASAHGGDAGRLLDRVSFLRKVESLDPSADDFATKVGDEIKAAVAADNTLRAPGSGQGEQQQNGAGARRLHDPSQGSSGRGRDANTGSVQAGRDLYAQRRGQKAGAASS